MKMIRILLGLMIALSINSTATAENLMDIYQRALRQDPSLREAEANRLATLENKPQAVSALLPQLDTGGSYGYRESDGSSVVPGILGDVSVGFDQNTPTLNWDVQLRQSVFNWDQWVALRRADKQVAQARCPKDHAGHG